MQRPLRLTADARLRVGRPGRVDAMNTRYWRLLRYALRQWRTLVAILGLTVLASGLAALQPWPVKILVDAGLGGASLPASWQATFAWLRLPTSPEVILAAVALSSLGLFVLMAAVEAGLTLGWAAAGQRMVFQLTADLFARLQRLSLLFHARRSVGDSLSRLTVDTWSIYSVTSELLVSPFEQAILLATVGTVAFRLDRGLALISLAMAPLLAASSVYFGRRLKHRATRTREAQARLTGFVQQTLASILLVQAFSAEGRHRRQYGRLAEDVTRWTQRGALIASSYGLVNGFITTAGLAVILYFGAGRVRAGELTVGGLLVFLAYVRSMQQASQGLLQMYGSLKPVEASIDRLFEILDMPESVTDAPGARALPRRSPDPCTIAFEHVSFSYDTGRPVLRDISLEARPGEMIALVGATGAGKTTLVSMVPRFFDPREGRVMLNGVDLRTVRLADLRARISMVLQEPFLLPLTVAENIAYGRPAASRDDIVSAAVAANADEFIRQLPNGYDTEIGERGATLSGGQRQRLSIARALLKDAPVLILDEPTSALDARTESQVLDALDRLMAGRTVFVIAHRLSTVRRADRILVLDQGAIVESGSHEALLHAQGAYARLHAAQFRDHLPGASA
jgi:ATP-binding cassette, subfamily B, bacterial